MHIGYANNGMFTRVCHFINMNRKIKTFFQKLDFCQFCILVHTYNLRTLAFKFFRTKTCLNSPPLTTFENGPPEPRDRFLTSSHYSLPPAVT